MLTLTSATLTGNSAHQGGGIDSASQDPVQFPYQPASRLAIENSLISGNRADRGREVANAGVAVSEGYNLFGYSQSSGVDGMTLLATDQVPQVGLNRILAPLANNGGPTQTHALVSGSPAINRGNPKLFDSRPAGISQSGSSRHRCC